MKVEPAGGGQEQKAGRQTDLEPPRTALEPGPRLVGRGGGVDRLGGVRLLGGPRELGGAEPLLHAAR